MGNRSRSAVVLAGGYSTRFGTMDKALATIDGAPMIVRVVTRLATGTERIVVSCRDSQRPEFNRELSKRILDVSVEFAVDPKPDGGPLAGIAQSFQHIETTHAAVVACDMPFVDPSFIGFLFDRASGFDAVVPQDNEGHCQPTQAVYNVDQMVAVAARRLAADKRSLHGSLSELDTRVIPAATVSEHTTWRSLRDINTRAEFSNKVSGDTNTQHSQ